MAGSVFQHAGKCFLREATPVREKYREKAEKAQRKSRESAEKKQKNVEKNANPGGRAQISLDMTLRGFFMHMADICFNII